MDASLQVRLVQSVSHPNIIQYLDAFIANNELYIAFEWAEAGDLKRQIRKANEKSVRFDERTIWRYFAQLCAAILHMHQARIMHRDLKPANIFLTLQGVVKVGDLGLGRHLSENTMEAHSKVGTPLYMSPEVLRGEGYDWKSDVWSLGCILYELAMLRSPFKAEGLNLYGLFQKINKGDYEAIPPIYSDHLRRLVTRMISLTASDRPSMEEVWSLCQTRPSSAMLAEKKERTQTQAAAAVVEQPDQEGEKVAARLPGAAVVRRRKMRAKEVPPPEDTPPSSRPPSQQKQEENSSSSSRPPSSQRSTNNDSSIPGNPDEVTQKHLEVRMEFLFERLRLLGYEKALRKRISCKHFLADNDKRSLPQVNPQARFDDMCILVKWLLRMLGADIVSELQSERSPVMVAQIMLLGAERAGAVGIAHLSAPALTSGVGEEVCVLLDALCEKALHATTRSVQFPRYPKDAVEEMEAQENLEVGADDDQEESTAGGKGGDWGDSTTSSPGIDDDLFAKWLVVKDENPATASTNGSDPIRDPSNQMIHSCIDPAAWRRELERMTPKLRDLMAENVRNRPKESSWHARMDMMQQNVGQIVSKAPDTSKAIIQAHKVGGKARQGMCRFVHLCCWCYRCERLKVCESRRSRSV